MDTLKLNDRMRPIHDYPRGGGAGSQNVEISYNHYPPEVNNSGGTHQNVHFLSIGIIEKTQSLKQDSEKE